MMRKIVQIAFYEARISCRGWRFWLLLALTAGISLFARRDYLLRVKGGLFLHSAFSFQHPSFWLMLSIFGLGASALALDICGRLRSTRMDKILFLLPVRPIELMLGRLLGVMAIMIPLSLAGVFSLAFWQYLYGHGAVVWQPFWYAFFLLALPVLTPIAALAITMRTFFKHDFAALIIGGALGAALAGLGLRYGVWIDVKAIIQHLVSASPTLGVRIPFERYWLQFILHGLLSLAFLYLAPLYLRRQEPQRWIVRRDANRWVGFSSLLRIITNLKFDRHLGWKYRLTLVLILVSSSAGVLWAAYWRHDNNRLYAMTAEESAVRVNLPAHRVDVRRYQIELEPSAAYDRLDVDARLTFTTDTASRYLAVELDRRFLIDEAFYNDVPCSY
ncbi:MAG: ABC transporter permease, partial [Candidatus Hinthialibacter sp.]